MSEIVQKWLSTRLGIILDINLLSFGEITKDGYLISQILHNYGILNLDDTERICRGDNYENAIQNLLYLNNYFKILGIDYTRKKLEAVARGDGMMCLRLFYQLYLILNNKDKLYFLTNRLADEKSEEIFNSGLITEPTTIVTTKEVDLDSSATVYNWHKNNYLEHYSRCKEIRQKYLDLFEKDIKNKHEVNTKPEETRMLESNTDILLTLNQHIQKIPNFNNVPNINHAKEYISNLKKKSQKFIEEKKLQQFMHKIFMHNLLQTLLENQREEYVASINNKLLKQSYYEKQMETKLLEVRKQKDTIIENKTLENNYLMKLKDEQFISELYEKRHNVAFANLRTTKERKRILDLHRKLYREKRRQKYLKHLNMARLIVNDLFTLTMKFIEYKDNYKTDVPTCLWKDWISFFCIEKDLDAPSENIEDILEDQDIFTNEIYRQNKLDEKDMKDYFSSDWPWNLEEMSELYDSTVNIIKLTANIMGFIVHRLLKVKYPLPPPVYTPVLPKVATAACVVGCTDENLIGVLETILKKKHILVIDMNTAINYCLKSFLSENPFELPSPPGGAKGKKSGKGKESPGKESKKGGKPKSQQKGNSSTREEKEVQTPKLFPGEDFQFSPKALLGKYAFETMNLGLPLNESLIANIFVEFLKSVKEVKGWVLMNYPETIPAAITLESALTGQNVPLEMNIDEYEYSLMDYLRDELYVDPIDEYAEKRRSKFLPFVTLYYEKERERSYLNSFIYLMQSIDQDNVDLQKSEYIQNFTQLKNFYDSLGCNNSTSYLSLDQDTIKDIILKLTNDKVFAEEIYHDIITIVNETLDANRKKREEEEARLAELEAAKSKGKGKSTGKDKGKKTVETELVPPVVPVNTRIPSDPIVVITPVPGEEKWPYINLPQNPEIQKNLATLWEDVEEIYVNDFKQIFFLKRVCQNAIVPYVHKIFTHMINYIERPDNKQEYVYKFQLIYNELENDLREDDEFKAEMHCRILEFKSKLWDICVSKMRQAEEERIRIINENWFYEQTTAFITIYNSANQLELDRSYNTFLFLQDYYYSMTPTGLIDNKYIKYTTAKYEMNQTDLNFVVKIYSDITCTIESNPFVIYLNLVLEEAMAAVTTWYTLATANNKKLNSFVPKAPKAVGKKPPVTSVEPLTDFQKKIPNLIEEWQAAIEGEYLRIKYRLNLLHIKARHDLYELLLYGENLFHELYSKINTRYHEELNSVNKVCDVFSKAVEACESIQPRLILDGNKFYVESNELLYQDPIEVPDIYKEDLTNYYFTITQLSKIADIFLDLAPRDSIPIKSFMYILQDMVVHIPKNNEDCLLPYHWHLLSPDKVDEIVRNIFGKLEYVSWKDFIIYNLELPFPNDLQIQTTRHQFRELDPDKLEFVNEVQFKMVEFWFDNEERFIKDPKTRILLKELLAKIFRISEDRINYSLLLLSFCKDKDPIAGVAKALGLSMGKLICYDEEIGKNYIEILDFQRYLKEHRQEEDVADNVSNATASEVPKETYSATKYDGSEYGEMGSFIFDDICAEEIYEPFVPELCYILPFNVILIIMTATLPWHYRVQCIQDNSLKETFEIMYESCKKSEYDCVFSHEFLNSAVFKTYLKNNNKFLVVSPAEMVKKEIEICKCTKDRHSMSIHI